jgi:hypothetical protein
LAKSAGGSESDGTRQTTSPGHVERLAARGQDREVGAPPEEDFAELGGRPDEVLAVVQHEEQPSRPQRFAELVGRALPGSERDGHRPRHQVGVRQRAQVDQEDAVGEGTECVLGGPDPQPGLPGSPDPGQGDQPVGAEQLRHFLELRLTSDETGEGLRQVVAVDRQRPQRRKGGGQGGMGDLEHVLGTGEVGQAVLAEIEEAHVGRQVVADDLVGRARDDDLATVGHRHQAGDPVEGRSEVVAHPVFRPSDVDAHADGKLADRPQASFSRDCWAATAAATAS